jgi:hypothetical protein
MTDIADPRTFPPASGSRHAAMFDLAASSLGNASMARADELDRRLAQELARHLLAGDAASLVRMFDDAPSAAVARHLWRLLIQAWREASQATEGEGVRATLFMVPVVIVAGSQTASAVPALDGVLAEPERVRALLCEHRAIGGSQSFALASALAAVNGLGAAQLPTLLRWQREALTGADAVRDLAPAPIAVPAGHETAHLRFLVGTALAAPDVDLLAAADTGRWALPLAQELGRQLAVPGVSILALPGVPAPPPTALQRGRAAHRSVGAELFASNAIRRLRASVGEPCAVISAHRCPEAPGGGELRLSLSSVFDSRQAEGFRCPLFPIDAAADVATMLTELMRDCRVADVRVVAGVHADRDPATGLALLFKADSAPATEPASLH